MPENLFPESHSKKFQQREIKTIAKNILKGLKFANEKNVVHTSEFRFPNPWFLELIVFL
jgi:serine/threonine protein kinase